MPDFVTSTPFLVIAGVVILILLIAFVSSRYHVAGANEALIVAGSRGAKVRDERGQVAAAPGDKGVKVVSYDGDTTPDARTIFVAPTTNKGIGAYQVKWVASQMHFKGQFAILSATPTSGNQNTWIKFMKLELKKKAYKNMKLVKIAYGNDNPTDSAKQTQSLLQAYPKLKGIISPTTVGIQAAAQELQQEGKCKSVALTGLGLPNDMRKYVKKGCAKKFGLWNEKDLGYLATYVAHYVVAKKLDGSLGQTFTAGRLGKYKVVASDGNKPVVVLGPPLVFTPKNIDKYHF